MRHKTEVFWNTVCFDFILYVFFKISFHSKWWYTCSLVESCQFFPCNKQSFKILTLKWNTFKIPKNPNKICKYCFRKTTGMQKWALPIILDLAASAFCIFLQTMITLAPLAAKSLAVSKPIPVFAPKWITIL